MDLIGNLLGTKQYKEPSEIDTIKEFVMSRLNSTCTVSISPRYIAIIVASSALAGELQLRLHELKRLCDTDKKLIIRIG